MNVLEIVHEKIKSSGADGLCHTDTACGCGLDDFAPCDNINGDCETAKRYRCQKCGDDVYIPAAADPDGRHHADCGGALGLPEPPEKTE